jgi:hypothetical protein
MSRHPLLRHPMVGSLIATPGSATEPDPARVRYRLPRRGGECHPVTPDYGRRTQSERSHSSRPRGIEKGRA